MPASLRNVNGCRKLDPLSLVYSAAANLQLSEYLLAIIHQQNVVTGVCDRA